MNWNNSNLIRILQDGGVAVIPTDTLYGIVGSALNEKVINRIYKIRKRKIEKPCIILIGDISELEKFSIVLSDEQENEIKKYWFPDKTQGEPGPVSIVLDCFNESLTYLHRGTNTLAFRLPRDMGLQNLLKETGPLVAPSANLEGLLPAKNIQEAREYFGNSVDFYLDGGEILGRASKILRLHKNGSISILRE
jgi:L-threonylcarbamoyladenylate synthase